MNLSGTEIKAKISIVQLKVYNQFKMESIRNKKYQLIPSKNRKQFGKIKNATLYIYLL